MDRMSGDAIKAIATGCELFESLISCNDTPLDLDSLSEPAFVLALEKELEEIKSKFSVVGIDRLALTYLKMYDIYCYTTYCSERLGRWQDYVQSIEQMLPYLAATGHRSYTKSIARWLDVIDHLDTETLESFENVFLLFVELTMRLLEYLLISILSKL